MSVWLKSDSNTGHVPWRFTKSRTCELDVFTCNLIGCIIVHVGDESSINEPESKSLLLRITYLYSNGWKFDFVSTEYLV